MLRRTSVLREDRRGDRCAASLVLVFCALLFTQVACGRVNATRDFNHGIRYFNEKNYPAAIRSFERATQSLAHPQVRYNLALAHLKALEAAENPSASEARTALESVTLALESEAADASLQARLHYIAGSIHHLTGNPSAARTAFETALKHQSRYAPALRALVQLEGRDDSPLARLVLATASIEEPSLEEDLPL